MTRGVSGAPTSGGGKGSLNGKGAAGMYKLSAKSSQAMQEIKTRVKSEQALAAAGHGFVSPRNGKPLSIGAMYRGVVPKSSSGGGGAVDGSASGGFSGAGSSVIPSL